MGQHTARKLNVRCDPIANDLDILNSGKLIGHVNALGQIVGGASTRQKVHALRLVDDILANLKNSAIAHDTDVAVAADILVIFAVGVIVVGIGSSHDEYFQFNDEWKSNMCHFGLPRPSHTRYDCPPRASHVHLCPIRDTHSSRNALVREVLPLAPRGRACERRVNAMTCVACEGCEEGCVRGVATRCHRVTTGHEQQNRRELTISKLSVW